MYMNFKMYTAVYMVYRYYYNNVQCISMISAWMYRCISLFFNIFNVVCKKLCWQDAVVDINKYSEIYIAINSEYFHADEKLSPPPGLHGRRSRQRNSPDAYHRQGTRTEAAWIPDSLREPITTQRQPTRYAIGPFEWCSSVIGWFEIFNVYVL